MEKMKNKNKKLMIVVACLLVVIGVSFAYFAASNFIDGSGSSADFTTATIQGSELRVDGNLTFNDLDIYPGHQNVSSIKVTAIGDNELIPYNVIWEGTDTLNTSLNYIIYKTSSEVDVSVSCEQQRGVIDGAMMYYEECEISNIDSLGTAISSGTINTNDTKVTLISDEFITSTVSGTEMYYYVILEYPNLEENQNSDIGGSFTGRVTIELSDVEPDINIIAAYIEQEDGTYEEVNDIPQSGYTINTEKSTCSNGAVPSWDLTDNSLKVSSLTKSGTSCYLYFSKLAKEMILANYNSVLTRSSFDTVLTDITTGTIYKSLDESQYDNDGEVYYFAGNPTDNWVSFGGFYWRIIRINGDGTIRLMYQGTEATTTGVETQIGSSVFNNSFVQNEYVGFKYTDGIQHGSDSDSAILTYLTNWYVSNLINYEEYIDVNTGFCSDRNLRDGSSWSSTGYTYQYYAAYDRLVDGKSPSFKCDNIDNFQIPTALITADEIAYAGGVWNTSNYGFYLYTAQDYWTMTPSVFNGTANNFALNRMSSLIANSVSGSFGVRPVINLKADVTITGSGTSTDPYVVS